MKTYQEFTRNDRVPRRYELLWGNEMSAFVLRMHEKVLTYLQDRLEETAETDYVKGMEREYELSAFAVNPQKCLGYGGILKRREETGDYAEFVLQFPKTSKDILASAASLSVLTAHLYDCGVETDSESLQLMDFWTNMNIRISSGCAVHGETSPAMGEWLRSLYRKRGVTVYLPSIGKAMRDAYRQIKPEYAGNSTRDFEVRIDSAGFYINYLEDLCGLNPCSKLELQNGKGHEFGCHNVHGPLQQLTLLVGLAALWTKAKEEINEDNKDRSE